MKDSLKNFSVEFDVTGTSIDKVESNIVKYIQSLVPKEAHPNATFAYTLDIEPDTIIRDGGHTVVSIHWKAKVRGNVVLTGIEGQDRVHG